MDVVYNDYYCLNADKSKEGGFARIIKVKHKDLEYVRALKVLNVPVFSENDKVYQTFLKECRTLLKIGNGCHPNIVRIYQPRLINQNAVVEMDYVNGETLEEYLEREKFMPIDDVYKFIRQIGGALAYCHVDIYLDQMDWDKDELDPDPMDAKRPLIDEAKRQELIERYHVVHNDLHSANVMRRHYDGDFILLDFGLAIQNGACVKSSSRREGAAEYKSPEKWENLNVETTQNDIYSFGVLLYKALTGQEPFPLDKKEKETMPEKAINDVREMHLHNAPPAIGPKREAAYKAAHPGQPWRRDYPDWLVAMVMKCLEKDPNNRYTNAKELVNDFNQHLAEDQANQGSQMMTEKMIILQNRLNHANDTISKLESELSELKKSGLSAPVQILPDMNNDTYEEIAIANDRADRAEQENGILRSKIGDLEQQLARFTSVPPIGTSASESKSWLKIFLWALLGVALGILLGFVCYNLFFDKSNDNSYRQDVELVEVPVDDISTVSELPEDDALGPIEELPIEEAPAEEPVEEPLKN